MRRKIIYPLLLSVLSFVMLFTAIFAWFTLQEQANVGFFQVSVEDYRLKVTFEVSKNREDYHEVENGLDLFENAVPSDTFAFRLKIENQGNTTVNVFARFPKIQSFTTDKNFNLLDVFYIEDGIIYVDLEEYLLNPTDYRLSNLIDEYGGLTILDNQALNPGEQTVIIFVIIYDEETSDLGYQNGRIEINELRIYSQ